MTYLTLVRAARKPVPAPRFVESQHPRDGDGKFAALGMRNVRGPDGTYPREHGSSKRTERDTAKWGYRVDEVMANFPEERAGISRVEALQLMREADIPEGDMYSALSRWRGRGWRGTFSRPIDREYIEKFTRSMRVMSGFAPNRSERRAELPPARSMGGTPDARRDRMSMKYRPGWTPEDKYFDEDRQKWVGDSDEERRARTAARRRSAPKKPTKKKD